MRWYLSIRNQSALFSNLKKCVGGYIANAADQKNLVANREQNKTTKEATS